MTLQILESDAFDVLSDDALAGYAEKLGEIDDVAGIQPGRTMGQRYALPFYDDVTLLVFTDPQWLPKDVRVCFLENGEVLSRLTGSSPPLHEVNAKAPILLTEANMLIYLVFFCFFVRGEEGPFFLLESPDSIFLPDLPESPDIFDLSRKPKSWGETEEGHWRASATVFYSNAVFAADFIVQSTGMIEMANDTPLVADLNFHVSAPLVLEGILQS